MSKIILDGTGLNGVTIQPKEIMKFQDNTKGDVTITDGEIDLGTEWKQYVLEARQLLHIAENTGIPGVLFHCLTKACKHFRKRYDELRWVPNEKGVCDLYTKDHPMPRPPCMTVRVDAMSDKMILLWMILPETREHMYSFYHNYQFLDELFNTSGFLFIEN
jgi:hypothetical protein